MSDDDGYLGPPDERPPSTDHESENATWVREMRRILDSPLGDTRPALIGTPEMASRLAEATRGAPHFAPVTGILSRAIGLSATARRPLTLPRLLLLARPGIGKTRYLGVVAEVIGTKFVPVAMNATSDRFQLSGLSSFWRHSRMGKLAKGLLECPTASPLFAFDELDKATRISGDNVVDVLLSVLEPESAKAFVDEYISVPLDLSYALFLATANSTQPIPAPILSRLTVIEIPDPSAEQSRVVVRSIAREVIDTCAGPALRGITDQAVTRCVGIDARQVRKILELACPIAVCAKRSRIGAADVDESLALLDGAKRPTMGFLG